MMAFSTFLYFSKNFWNMEPNKTQQELANSSIQKLAVRAIGTFLKSDHKEIQSL